MAINAAQPKRGLDTGWLIPGDAGRGLATGSLRTDRDIANERLMGLAGKKGFNVDPLQPGGFANRDRIAQQVRSAAQDEKRRKRIVNHAYRQALRSGDRIKAMEVLISGEKNWGVTSVGGIRPAGETERNIMQQQGEDFITAFQRQQRSGQGGGAQAAEGGLQTGGVETGRVGGRGPQVIQDGPVQTGGANTFEENRRRGVRGLSDQELFQQVMRPGLSINEIERERQRRYGSGGLPDEKSLSGSAYNKALAVDLFRDRKGLGTLDPASRETVIDPGLPFSDPKLEAERQASFSVETSDPFRTAADFELKEKLDRWRRIKSGNLTKEDEQYVRQRNDEMAKKHGWKTKQEEDRESVTRLFEDSREAAVRGGRNILEGLQKATEKGGDLLKLGVGVMAGGAIEPREVYTDMVADRKFGPDDKDFGREEKVKFRGRVITRRTKHDEKAIWQKSEYANKVAELARDSSKLALLEDQINQKRREVNRKIQVSGGGGQARARKLGIEKRKLEELMKLHADVKSTKREAREMDSRYNRLNREAILNRGSEVFMSLFGK